LGLDEASQVVSIKHYGKGEGFTGIECNARGCFLDRQNELWFASIDGPFRYRKDLDARNEHPPILHLTAVKIFFDEEITYGYMKGALNWFGLPKELILPAYHNHLTFEVDGINFFSPSDVKYSYKLEGVDKNWTPLTAVSSVTYSNLQEGTYYFKVKAYNSDGVEVADEVVYGPIVIEPDEDVAVIPYWMWVTLVLLASGLVFFVGYMLVTRDRRMKKMRRILEEKVKTRTAEVEKQNLEKEVMLKEIHHRVKNNLQIINSLMNLQADNVEDQMVKDVFREARNRIASMALIHEKIYESRSMVNVKMKDYIRELVHKLIDSYKITDNVRLQMNIGDDVLMNLNHIVPVGLILNEVISNSLKYAFPGDRKGRIYIELKTQPDGSYLLIAGDDGIGLPKAYDVTNFKTLGIELIHMLTEQLGGQLEIKNNGGLEYVLSFGKQE
jgi:two-component sensor histidine kinase